YANRKYACIIHISDALENENQLTVDVDNYLMDLIKNTKTKYFIKKDSALVDVLDTISTDMKFPSIISSKTAWEKAQRDVLNKI
ncbi:MAG: hypothetical protein LIO93_07530, partial [Bacteroidales bacterium]|nr:hypothetical protein [Bacteroidales bacterium]